MIGNWNTKKKKWNKVAKKEIKDGTPFLVKSAICSSYYNPQSLVTLLFTGRLQSVTYVLIFAM